MTKRLKKALTILALAFAVSGLGLVGGAAFEAVIAPDQVRATCEDQKCDGADDCTDAQGQGCDDNINDCTTYNCGVE